MQAADGDDLVAGAQPRLHLLRLAAALLRNWLRGTSGTIDPGQVYAQLILSGQQPYPFNNTSGAGPLRWR